MSEELVILGAGGSAGDIAWTVEEVNRASERWMLRGFLDDDPAEQGGSVCGYPILGALGLFRDLPAARFLIGIAHYRRPLSRNQVAARPGLPAERYATLVHPAESVSPYAQVGAGTVNPR